jgi:tetratricopeptide (TPR) repeat protein
LKRPWQSTTRARRAHVNLAFALERLGRADDAIAHYRQASEIDPNLFQARYNYGLCLEKAGRSR